MHHLLRCKKRCLRHVCRPIGREVGKPGRSALFLPFRLALPRLRLGGVPALFRLLRARQRLLFTQRLRATVLFRRFRPGGQPAQRFPQRRHFLAVYLRIARELFGRKPLAGQRLQLP